MQAGRLATAELDSFPDLGQVRYNNCNISPTRPMMIEKKISAIDNAQPGPDVSAVQS